jgi:hypothetical protein
MVLFPTFKDYLAELPTDIVFKHFLSRQGQGRKILSSSSINEITHQMSSEKSIRERFLQLSPAGRYTCGCIYLFGKRGFEAPDIAGFDNELLASFLVFAGRDETGKTFYFGFPEFESRIAPLAATAIIDKAKIPAPREPAAQSPWLCLRDVMVLCICASAGMLKTTRKGTFTKVSESVLKRFLYASHDLTADGAGLILRLLFGHALAKELMLLDNDIYKPIPHKILAWMAIPLTERYADFCEFAVSAAPLWSRPVIDALFKGPQQQWVSLPLPEESVRKDARTTLLCLWYFGLLDVNRSGGSLAFTRPKVGTVAESTVPSSSGRIILLADFSAVLTREVLPEDLYWFSKAGTLESFDSVYKGMIRRQTINDSLSEGNDEKKLVEWLETWRAPSNVLATVKEWIREFSRMYFTTDATIVSVEERATKQILSYEPLKRLIEPVKAHFVFRIRPGHEQEVKRILQSMGFDPRMPGESVVGKRAVSGETASQDPIFDAPQDGAPKDAPLSAFDPEEAIRTGRISPVIIFGQKQEQAFRPVKAGKYGQKLKELDMSDLFHVLDYAVLMGHPVTFEYKGSQLVRKGMYKVLPLNVHKASEPFCDGEVLPKKTKKKFLLRCIIRIGVESA